MAGEYTRKVNNPIDRNLAYFDSFIELVLVCSVQSCYFVIRCSTCLACGIIWSAESKKHIIPLVSFYRVIQGISPCTYRINNNLPLFLNINASPWFKSRSVAVSHMQHYIYIFSSECKCQLLSVTQSSMVLFVMQLTTVQVVCQWIVQFHLRAQLQRIKILSTDHTLLQERVGRVCQARSAC